MTTSQQPQPSGSSSTHLFQASPPFMPPSSTTQQPHSALSQQSFSSPHQPSSPVKSSSPTSSQNMEGVEVMVPPLLQMNMIIVAETQQDVSQIQQDV